VRQRLRRRISPNRDGCVNGVERPSLRRTILGLLTGIRKNNFISTLDVVDAACKMTKGAVLHRARPVIEVGG